MTISTTTTLNRYTGNGSTTVFPYTYRILAATDLVVTKLVSGTLVPLTLNYPADYSVSGVGNATGGSVTLAVTPGTGDLLVIERVMPITQSTSIRNNSSYFAETHENVFDRGTMVDQQQAAALGRTFSLPKTIDPSTLSMSLPVPVSGQTLIWGPTGLTNGSISSGSVVLPGEGRDTTTLTQYLANNYIYNVLDYDADPTGALDSTVAFKAALAAAVSTNGVVFAPRGTYLITPASTANAITVPANVSLIGQGFETVLKWNVSVITADGFYSTLLYNSNSRIANLQMDGQKSALVRSGRTSVQCVGISGATTNLSGFVLEDLWVHDIPAVNAESFGVMTAGGASDFQWRRIKSYNIEGTGLHVAGDGAMQANNLPLTPTTNADVDECVSHDNTWQGISVFGASNIRVRDYHAYNNNDATIKGAGINVEWSQEIDFYASVAHDNFVGAQVQGRSNNVRFWEPHLYNNNSALDAAYGEIRIVATTYTITPFPKGMPNNTEIHGGAIVPRTGSNHLYYKSDSAVTSSTGSHSIPDSIVLDHPDAASWTITTDGGSTHYTGLTLKVVRRQIGLPAPLEWYNPSSITISAYGGTGNVNANAATFAINAQFANAQGGWSLKANRRYLVHVRGKPRDANTWAIRAVDSGGTVREVLTFPSQAVDLNTWFAGDVVFVPTADCFLQLMLLTAPGGTSTFDLDYLRVFALADGDSQAADEPSDVTGVLTDGASVFVPVGTAGFYSVALGGSRTIKNANGGWNSKTIVLELQNNTGGAVTTTFESNYKLAGAWTDPATTKKRKIAFRRVSSTVWEEMWRSASDI